jgi:hypothetical protein
MILAFGFLSTLSVKAQVVRERPHHEFGVRGPQPSPRHVWRDDEWEWRGGAYVAVPGVWVEPEHGRRWRAGHWRRERGGERWQAGRWR